MLNSFLENAYLGKNTWWRYVFSIFAPVIIIALTNLVIRQILSSIKSLFPDNDFGKELGTYSLLFLVFCLALVAFMVAASKFHNRTLMSFISWDNTFSWKYYLSGFLLWGSLVFLCSLISDFENFEVFLKSFNPTQFWVLLLVGFVSIGVQSFFEEIIIRGYFLQGLHLRIKDIKMLVVVNALIFGVLHFGYGIESFLSAWFFGIAFAIIVLLQNRIEFVSGAHNAHNLLLSLVFLDLSEEANAEFSWSISWTEFGLQIVALTLLVGLVYKIFKK